MSGKIKILIAVDHSENATKAFDWYVNFLHRDGNYVVLIHNPEIPSKQAGRDFSPGVWQKLWNDEQAKIKALQAKYEAKMKENQLNGKFVTVERIGSAGEGICALAKKENVSAIVIGTRGLGTIRRTVMGSVSDYVLHHALIPVCICRQ